MKLMLFCPCLLSGTFMSVSFISMQHGFFYHYIVFYLTNIPLTSLLFCFKFSVFLPHFILLSISLELGDPGVPE